MDEIAIDIRCGTCTHERGGHYVSYGGTAGCMCRVGIENPIPCPCIGFMLTESETLKNEWRHAVGMAVYHNVAGRQRTADRMVVPGVGAAYVICRVDFTDGTHLNAHGAHEAPYLKPGTGLSQPGFDQETLESLAAEWAGDEDDD